MKDWMRVNGPFQIPNVNECMAITLAFSSVFILVNSSCLRTHLPINCGATSILGASAQSCFLKETHFPQDSRTIHEILGGLGFICSQPRYLFQWYYQLHTTNTTPRKYRGGFPSRFDGLSQKCILVTWKITPRAHESSLLRANREFWKGFLRPQIMVCCEFPCISTAALLKKKAILLLKYFLNYLNKTVWEGFARNYNSV